MKNNKSFDNLISQISAEAENQHALEAAANARHAKIAKIKAALGTVLFLTAVGLLIAYNDPLRDQLGLNNKTELGYKRIMNLAKGVDTGKPLDPNSREGKLQALMQQAEQRSSLADNIMAEGIKAQPTTNRPAVAKTSTPATATNVVTVAVTK